MKFLLSKEEVENILKVMEKFPRDEKYQLDYRADSGIGSTLDIIIPTVVDEIYGHFTVNITSPEDW